MKKKGVMPPKIMKDRIRQMVENFFRQHSGLIHTYGKDTAVIRIECIKATCDEFSTDEVSMLKDFVNLIATQFRLAAKALEHTGKRVVMLLIIPEPS